MSSSFRPIAPAANMDIYAGSCNPPRRAKRRRSHSRDDSPSQPEPEPEPEPDLDAPAAAPKRRGRRPGTLSRAAREAQRKINHSLIEKARRTKINDALATLRELVPPEYKRQSDLPDDNDDNEDEDDLDPKKPRPKPKSSGEKEFKLEILVRTVAYLQDLTEKVDQLERKGCPHCTQPISLAAEPSHGKRHEDTSSDHPSRLPSISTWLPSSAEPLLLTPSQSPPVPTRPTQLPTPPTSATCPPATHGFPIPPVLTLPSPSALLPTTTHIQPRFSGFRTNPKSPLSSPVYTPDDETAASLLLRISATSARTPSVVRPTESEPRQTPASGYALTPSRLLGLNAER